VNERPYEPGGTFKVRVTNERFVAGHMATFSGNCERLHGHNYEVAAEVEGELTNDSWVVDFVALKKMLRAIIDEIDHRFMLQADSRVLDITQTDAAWQIKTPAGAVYVLPREDVIPLPIDNTTAERLAEWFSNRVWQSLMHRRPANVRCLTIEVSEGPDQKASHRRDRLPLG
jgi:6-pyruvoyltetrahydropterin/6-carboxytetrahydropterin synthase